MGGKTIIVTGASRGTPCHLSTAKRTRVIRCIGIGFSIAEYLISKSHNVVLLARTAEPLEILKAKSPAKVSVCAGDLADYSIAEKCVAIAKKDFGQLDGLVLNHGILAPATRIADSSPEEWRHCFDVNFFSLIDFVR